jgi:hypothetical protein
VIARWRAAGLVASPEWHWALQESRDVAIRVDIATAHRLRAEAERRGTTVPLVVRDLWEGRTRSAGTRGTVSDTPRPNWHGASSVITGPAA